MTARENRMPASLQGVRGHEKVLPVPPPETHPVAYWALGGHSAPQASRGLSLNPVYFREKA